MSWKVSKSVAGGHEMKDRALGCLRPREGRHRHRHQESLEPMKGFLHHKGILAIRSQKIPQSHTMQQTSHKRLVEEKDKMEAASDWEERKQRTGRTCGIL